VRRFIVIIAAIGVAVLAAIGAMRGTVRLGAEGYVYGYPLVIMDAIMQQIAATHVAATRVRAPTLTAWMIGRIQTNGEADCAFVHGLQGQLRFRSLDDYLADRPRVLAGDWHMPGIRRIGD
jgi:hypothetical protein